MPYNDKLRERIAQVFQEKGLVIEGKKFMGGYCFFLDEKMCVGINTDKETGRDRLMSRIGEAQYPEAMQKPGCRPMDITGRPMKGFVFVDPIGFEDPEALEYWIDLAVHFNPEAKRSKKRKKTS